MAESDISLSVKTSADTAGLDQVTQKLAAVESAAEKAAPQAGNVQAAIAKLETTAPEAATAVKKLQEALAAVETEQAKVTKTSGAATAAHHAETGAKMNSAQASQALGRAFQDLQGGVGGVLNNIEQLVMGLGGGAGLAGVLTLVSTALYFLGPPIWNLITGEDEAAKKAAKMAEETHAAAEAAFRLAAGADRSRESQREHVAAMQAITTAVDDYSAAVERAIKLREQFRRMQLEESDSKAALDLAKIDQAEKAGKLTPQQAERSRAGVRVETETRRYEADQQRLDEQKAAAETEAALRRAEAEKTAAERKRIEQAGKDMTMSPEDIKAAEKANEESRLRIEEYQKKANEAQFQIGGMQQRTGINPAADAVLAPAIEKLKQEAENMKRAAEDEKVRIRDREAEITKNRIAREDTGLDSPEALKKRREELLKQEEDARKKAEDEDVRARMAGEEKGSRGRAFETRKETMEIQSGNRIMDMDKADAEAKKREEEKAAREAERAARKPAGRGPAMTAPRVPSDTTSGGDESGIMDVMKEWSGAQAAHGAAFSQLADLLKSQIPNLKEQTLKANAAAAAVRSP